MQRLLIGLGVLLVLAGLGWPRVWQFLARLPFGALPGDIGFRRGGFGFYFPLGTCIVLSVVLSLLLSWLGRR